jgi:BirA family biotin operon repressor/biotin-[acetyl-CoA-carboxylase] ligase
VTAVSEGARRLVGPNQALLEFETVPSTMDIARLALAANDRAVIGVRADHQSKGRGRRGAAWLAPPKTCLLITYLLRSDRPPDPARLAFAAGVAVAETIEATTGLVPGLKWPNDVLLDGRKAAGVLIEAHGSDSLVGIGLNVNIESVPPDLARVATSLSIQSGRSWSLDTLEAELRSRLFDLRKAPWESVMSRWRRYDQTAGRAYLAAIDGVERQTTAVGISESGALLVQTPTGQIVPVLSATSAL